MPSVIEMSPSIRKSPSVLLNGSRFAVVGAARSGYGATQLLLELGKSAVIYDDKEKVGEGAVAELSARGVGFVWGKLDGATAARALADVDGVIVSPGIPMDHPLRIAARERNIPMAGEIELAWLCSGRSKTLAVTGTKGKTTTTMLMTHVLQEGGLPVVSAGNIGNSYSEAVLAAGDDIDNTLFCLEVSSFQLEDSTYFRPDVAVVVNFSPDHLDRHKTMEEYWEAKRRITLNQTEADTLIVNQDDALCLKIAQGSRSRVMRYSLVRAVNDGAWLDHDMLMLAQPEKKPQQLMEMNKLKLRGMHNVANALAAACAGMAFGVSRKAMATALESFRGAPHRLEHIGTIRGVEYFNDSKGTNIDSVLKAIQSFNTPIHLIAGGQDKLLPFEAIRSEVRDRVARAYLIGEAAPKIEAAWAPDVAISHSGTLARALEEATEAAAPGEIILLSPACASFDQFKNAEHRGQCFNEWVLARKQQEEPS